MTTETPTPGGTAAAPAAVIELAVGGMTCSSCAARIEKKLNRVDGVEATVNFATETATVSYDPQSVTTQDLVAVVETTGYSARLPQPPVPAAGVEGEPSEADRGEAGRAGPTGATRPTACGSGC